MNLPRPKCSVPLLLALLTSACASLPQPGLPVPPVQVPDPPAEMMVSPSPQSFVTRIEELLSRSLKKQKP